MEEMIEMRPESGERKFLREGLLQFIDDLPHHLTMIEIGSYRGESAKIFLDSGKIDHITCIDPHEFSETTGGGDPEVIRQLLLSNVVENPKYAGRVLFIDKRSRDAVRWFDERSVDLVYIDGRHEAEYVAADIALFFPLIRPGGIIAGHDWQHIPVRDTVRDMLGEPDKTYPDFTWMKKID